jgi:hypothetical protein
LENEAESLDNRTVKLSIKKAGSLLLWALNLFLCAAGLCLAYTGLSVDWGPVIIWLVSPPLFLFTVAYLVVDLLKPIRRKQAIAAAILSAPVAFVVWHFRFRGI